MLQNLKEGQKVTRYGNVDWSEELFMATLPILARRHSGV